MCIRDSEAPVSSETGLGLLLLLLIVEDLFSSLDGDVLGLTDDEDLGVEDVEELLGGEVRNDEVLAGVLARLVALGLERGDGPWILGGLFLLDELLVNLLLLLFDALLLALWKAPTNV